MSLYVRETGRLKDPGVKPYTGTAVEGSARKGNLFREKWYIKGQAVGTRGGVSPYKNLLSTPRIKDASNVKSCLH